MRAVEDSANHWYAGLSSVHGSGPESTSMSPKPRPITALPTSLTGSAPGTAAGHRSRISWSSPVKSSTWLTASTRAMPLHRVSVCVKRAVPPVPTEPVTVTRWPSGLCSTTTESAGAAAEPVTGPPLGSKCHGPSPADGWAGYSS